MNAYLSLASKGIRLSFEKPEDRIVGAGKEGYELISKSDSKRYFEELLLSQIGQLYLKLDKCDEIALLFFILTEFNSLQ